MHVRFVSSNKRDTPLSLTRYLIENSTSVFILVLDQALLQFEGGKRLSEYRFSLSLFPPLPASLDLSYFQRLLREFIIVELI